MERGDQLTIWTTTASGTNNTVEATVVGIAEDFGDVSTNLAFANHETVRDLLRQPPGSGYALIAFLRHIDRVGEIVSRWRTALTAEGLEVLPYLGRDYSHSIKELETKSWRGQRLAIIPWQDELAWMSWRIVAANWICLLVVGILLFMIGARITTTMLAAVQRRTKRTWRHLDSCQFQTYLHASIPRVTCGKHGVVQVLVSWAAPRPRFTLLFERLAIDVLHQCDVSGATRILRISWDEAWGV